MQKEPEKSKINVNLDVYYFQDEDTHHMVAYIPALDISGYGDDKKEATESIKIVLQEYIRHRRDTNLLHHPTL